MCSVHKFKNTDDWNDRLLFRDLQNNKAQLQLCQGEKLAVECEVFDLQNQIAKLERDAKKTTQRIKALEQISMHERAMLATEQTVVDAQGT